jgi:hypothetical protein
MSSFVFDIGERSRRVSRVLGKVHSDLQTVFVKEKKKRKITQQGIANTLGVNRSVVNRQLVGTENLTVKSVVELAWAMGWEAKIELYEHSTPVASNEIGQNSTVNQGNMPVANSTGQAFLIIENKPEIPIVLVNTKEAVVRTR